MKALIIRILFLLIYTICVYAKDKNNIINFLEAGKFEKVNEIVNSLKDENYKNFVVALICLYNGEYELSKNYILKISSDWFCTDQYFTSEEKKFYNSYITHINEIISNGYNFYESEHFKVYLKDRDVILKDLILKKLEQIYSFYNNIFQYTIPQKVRVEVYNTKEEFYFASTLGKDLVDKTGVTGICKFNKIMIISPENLILGYRWCDTLAHEYVHFLLNKITEYTYPLYLHEGTARYFDTLYRSTEPLCFTPGNLKLLIEAKNNNSLIQFKDIKGSLVYLQSQREVELAFTQLASFVDYLIKNFGLEKFLNFVRCYKEYHANEQKLYKEIFGYDFETIVSEWLNYIDTKSETVKMYPGAQPDIKFFTSEYEPELIGLETRQYIELADRFLLNKNYNAALYQYKKAEQKENFNPVILTRIAKVYLCLKKYDEAKDVLKKCIISNPNFVTGYELLIKVYYETAEYEEAIKIYNDVLEINPFNYEIRKVIANIYSDLGRLKEALNEYEIVYLLNPADEKVYSIIDSIKRYLELKNKKQ